MVTLHSLDNGEPVVQLSSLQLEMKNQVEEKVADGRYIFEEVVCPVCHQADFEPIADRDRFGLLTPTVVCLECGLLQMTPRMTHESYNEFYDIEYRKLYGSRLWCSDSFFERQRRHGKQIYSYLKKFIPDLETRSLVVLEIGCGAGGILKYFKDQGHEAIGMDLGREYLEYGKEQHGLNLVCGAIESYEQDKKPDLIIYSHVFEHVLDLREELLHIHELLAEGGHLYLEVPSVKNLIRPYFASFALYLQNAHVYHFSLITLTNLLSQCGFERVAGNEMIQSVFKKTECQGSGYESDYDAVMKYLKNINFLSRIGLTPLLRTGHAVVRSVARCLRLR